MLGPVLQSQDQEASQEVFLSLLVLISGIQILVVITYKSSAAYTRRFCLYKRKKKSINVIISPLSANVTP